ncbi:MAG: phosphatase [Bacteroidia bacterium]|nr:phosphatase [Bacteroidia bacterium]
MRELQLHHFTQLGGSFGDLQESFVQRLSLIKAYLFDWDGVFNDGRKGPRFDSTFSEPDSMGVNLLRFGHWLRNGTLPATGILTGEDNPAAEYFSEREHLDNLYYRCSSKKLALDHFLQSHELESGEVAFVYDDVIDLDVAEKCGLRFLVRRKASPAFLDFVKLNSLADYITYSEGGQHAVREICELMLTAMSIYPDVMHARRRYSGAYETYLAARNSIDVTKLSHANASASALKL